MSPGNGEHPPRDPRQLDGLDTYPVAQVEAFVERIDELEAENKALLARVAELEAENKHLTQLLDGYRVHADAHRALLDKYDAERNGWLDVVGKASRAIDLFAKLARDLEQAKADRARASMDARNPLLEELAKLEARCKRLEEAGGMLEWRIACGCGHGGPCRHCADTLEAWQQAKEAKP